MNLVLKRCRKWWLIDHFRLFLCKDLC